MGINAGPSEVVMESRVLALWPATRTVPTVLVYITGVPITTRVPMKLLLFAITAIYGLFKVEVISIN